MRPRPAGTARGKSFLSQPVDVDGAVDALDSPDPATAAAGRLLVARFIEAFLDYAPGNWPTVLGALRA